MRAVSLLSLAGLLYASSLSAHDFWIQASPLVFKQGDEIEISLMTGNNLSGKSLPNRIDQFMDFSYIYDGRRIDVPGEMGRDPAGVISRFNRGGFVVGYQSISRRVALGRQAFTTYLHEEGLEQYSNQANGASIVEQYTRYAKALLRSTSAAEPIQWQADFGYRLELHPINNPYQPTPGKPLKLRLTFEQKAVDGALVNAFCADDAATQHRQRTDSAGEVSIALHDCQGLWLVKTVTMRPSTRPGIDFESFWASLTFVRE